MKLTCTRDSLVIVAENHQDNAFLQHVVTSKPTIALQEIATDHGTQPAGFDWANTLVIGAKSAPKMTAKRPRAKRA